MPKYRKPSRKTWLLMELAKHCGWNQHINPNTGAINLHAPDQPINIHLAANIQSWNQDKLSAAFNKILLYGDLDMAYQHIAEIRDIHDELSIRASDAVRERIRDMWVNQVLPKEQPEPQAQPEQLPLPTQPDPVADPVIGTYLAKDRKAKGQQPGKRYESTLVLERRHHDGTVDYLCRYCYEQGTEFTRPTPYGIVGHAKIHKDREPTDRSDLIDDPSYTTNTYQHTMPVDTRIKKLAAELQAAITGARIDWKGDEESIALEIAVWVIRNRDEQRHAEVEAEHDPVQLTPEQIIQRIQLLVSGELVAKIEQDQRDWNGLEFSLREKEQEIEHLQQQLHLTKENVRAINAMLSELSNEEDE